MNVVTEIPYPGSTAEAPEILDLACAYHRAATALYETASKSVPLSRAPVRMCAIHAIELYVNAFLRHEGVSPREIRGRLHNLSDLRLVSTLRLRVKTAQHLETLFEKREYLISRYGPELTSEHSQLNRLTATLEEVAAKVGRYLAPAGA